MTQLQQASSFNTEASLNAWLTAALQAFTLPFYIASLPPIVIDYPQVSAAIPCFSFTHIPVGSTDTYQGRNVGGTDKGARTTGMMDVSCWVSRSKAPSTWYPILMSMRDFVISAALSKRIVVISDYQASLMLPALTNYKINIDAATRMTVQHDPNPDVERERIIIDYSYVYRSA